MTAGRALCISCDAALRGAVDEAFAPAGVSVDHAEALPAAVGDASVVIVDRATRQAAGSKLRDLAAPVVVVGDDLDDDALVALMLDAPVSHLVEDPHDRDLGITSHKLATGDLFGLDKYVAPATSIAERLITDDPAKRLAIVEVCTWAESRGARRSLVHRLANVVDELLMNALRASSRATLRWACDDAVLGVSVVDTLGAIRQRDVIDNLRRARSERGRPQESTDGAGLGLYLVLANVASLIVNVEPGRRSEVVCLFDVAKLTPGARSLHVFATS